MDKADRKGLPYFSGHFADNFYSDSAAVLAVWRKKAF